MVKNRALLSLSGRHTVVLITLLSLASPVCGQYFQFSQYNFTPQRINPARVAANDDAELAFIYRNQGTDGGFRLSSNSLNAMYPIHARNGKRWSGVGISLLDDRSGQAGIFVTQEAGIAYAINITPSAHQSLSLGAKLLYQGRRMDLQGLYTGSQYIPDRGFDESLSPGENFGEFRSDYFTFSMGLHWRADDKHGVQIAYWDISFFDLNSPREEFITSSSLNPTMVAGGGLRVYHRREISIFPQVLYTRTATNNVVNAGAMFRYDLDEPGAGTGRYVNVLTGYVFGRSTILGLQFHNSRMGIGVSYDFPFFHHNVANTGAWEVGLALKKEVIKNSKKRKRKQQAKRSMPSVTARKPSNVVRKPAMKDSLNTSVPKETAPSLNERLRQKQDSIMAQGVAGIIQHDPLVLEKATLRFTFGFNSAEPGEDARVYLDELIQALKDNPELHLKLVGHTDNIGSDKFNLRLSLARAQAFRQYVVDRGIDASRVTVDGKGMREPLNGNSTPEEQALNRRVEMTILYAH